MTAATLNEPSAVQTQEKSAIHFWFGPGASHCRSRMLAEAIAAPRSPVSGGRPHRRGRARSACWRISRSISCGRQLNPTPNGDDSQGEGFPDVAWI